MDSPTGDMCACPSPKTRNRGKKIYVATVQCRRPKAQLGKNITATVRCQVTQSAVLEKKHCCSSVSEHCICPIEHYSCTFHCSFTIKHCLFLHIFTVHARTLFTRFSCPHNFGADDARFFLVRVVVARTRTRVTCWWVHGVIFNLILRGD